MRGQDSHETMKPSVFPRRYEASCEVQSPHRKAFPGGRQVQGKTRLVDRSAGQP